MRNNQELIESRITIGSIQTRQIAVSGKEPTFLLLHGFSDSVETWRPLLRELGALGRSALAVDMPGFGAAGPVASGPTLPQLDGFVATLVRENVARRKRPIIIGNSLGGVAGLRAAQDPDLPLGGVVAVSPAGLGHQPWVDIFERAPMIHTILSSPIPIPMPVVRWAARNAYGRFAFADRSRVDPSFTSTYAAQYRSRADIQKTIRGGRALLEELRPGYDFAQMTAPILLVWGDRDLLTPSKGARRLLDAVPGSELVLLERCGHCAQHEQPERIAELAVEFADRVGGRATAPAPA